MDALNQVRGLIGEGVRIHVDDRDAYSPGWKFNEWEMRGVPLRIEIGPRDVDQDQVMLVRRDLSDKGRKVSVPIGGELGSIVRETLEAIQGNLYRQALAFREEHTARPETYDGFREAAAEGFVEAWWCGDAACEAQIKEDTRATLRCMPLEQPPGNGICIRCGREADERAVFGRAY